AKEIAGYTRESERCDGRIASGVFRVRGRRESGKVVLEQAREDVVRWKKRERGRDKTVDSLEESEGEKRQQIHYKKLNYLIFLIYQILPFLYQELLLWLLQQ
ncbi:hypothetical protein, partial [Mesomycoplasma hyorhinis]|uniref:hypothetical protein n=1 Tax=Mesomycoplasma hyorhinis TaxID=2100 RepID=UPI001C04D41F